MVYLLIAILNLLFWLYYYRKFNKNNPGYSFFKNYKYFFKNNLKFDSSIEKATFLLLSTGVKYHINEVLHINHKDFTFQVLIDGNEMTIILLNIHNIMCDRILISSELKNALNTAKNV